MVSTKDFSPRRVFNTASKECAAFITQIKECLPGCVQQVLLRADGEFLSRHSVEAALAVGFNFIIANKGCEPYFEPDSWYRPYKRKDVEYNSCLYQPRGWQLPCRFVVMRIPKKTDSDRPIMVVARKYLLSINWCKIFFVPK